MNRKIGFLRTLFAGLLVLLLVAPTESWSAPSEVVRSLPKAKLIGKARVSVLLFKVYDAAYWAESSKNYRKGAPFALSLTYLRSVKSKDIVKASIDEMARITGRPKSAFNSLLTKLKRCFPGTRKGTRITGISTGKSTATFYVNGTRRCRVSFPGFRRAFFGIWLGPRSRDAQATRRLLGSR